MKLYVYILGSIHIIIYKKQHHCQAFHPNHPILFSGGRGAAFSRKNGRHSLTNGGYCRTFDDDDDDASAHESKPLAFTSDPMQVYIEDTDAYGVMYNSNYIRAYERAMLRQQQQQQQQQPQKQPCGNSCSLLFDPKYNDFYITKVTAHKFKSSPVLGSSYVIRARLLNIAKKQGSLIQQEESWSVDMVKYSPSYCKDGLDPNLSLSNNNSNDSIGDGVPPPVKEQPQVYNTAIVTIASRRTNANHHCTHAPPATGLVSRFSTTVLTNNNNCNNIQRCDVFTIHRDEFDIHLPNALPMRTVLNLFERQRSNWLGGPHVLKRMLTEYNLQWVVTSIDDLEIHTATSYYSQNDESFNHKTNVWVKPGMEVEVRSSIQVKRRGMILEFQQQVVQSSGRRTEDDNGDGVRNVLPPEVVLAQGVVTICAIDGKKGRPTRDIPPEVKRILSI